MTPERRKTPGRNPSPAPKGRLRRWAETLLRRFWFAVLNFTESYKLYTLASIFFWMFVVWVVGTNAVYLCEQNLPPGALRDRSPYDDLELPTRMGAGIHVHHAVHSPTMGLVIGYWLATWPGCSVTEWLEFDGLSFGKRDRIGMLRSGASRTCVPKPERRSLGTRSDSYIWDRRPFGGGQDFGPKPAMHWSSRTTLRGPPSMPVDQSCGSAIDSSRSSRPSDLARS